MGSINSLGQAVQEILLNNYLKSSFQNSEIRDFVPTFWNFIILISDTKLSSNVLGTLLRFYFSKQTGENPKSFRNLKRFDFFFSLQNFYFDQQTEKILQAFQKLEL